MSLSTFEEYPGPEPELWCVSPVHHVHPALGRPRERVRATWLVSYTWDGVELAYCASCHFLGRRVSGIGEFFSERHLPPARLVCDIEEGLSDPDLKDEIRQARQRAEDEGYQTAHASYQVLRLPTGAIRLTFVKA